MTLVSQIQIEQAVSPIDIARGALMIEEDGSMMTAVVISLFTDRRAGPDDVLPGGAGADPRGWWGDAVPASDGAGNPDERDRIGSRLWLLAREKQTQETLNRAVGYAREALRWLIDDGIAATVEIEAEWVARGVLGLGVVIGGLAEGEFEALFAVGTEVSNAV